MNQNSRGGARLLIDISIGVCVAVLAAVSIRYIDIPARISTIEAKQAALETAFNSIDKKLDILIAVKR